MLRVNRIMKVFHKTIAKLESLVKTCEMEIESAESRVAEAVKDKEEAVAEKAHAESLVKKLSDLVN